jgi:hypothetical protein
VLAMHAVPSTIITTTGDRTGASTDPTTPPPTSGMGATY